MNYLGDKKMYEAQCELKAQGKPYPRTCPVCRLGPCTRMVTLPSAGNPESVAMIVERMLNYRARMISSAIDCGDMKCAATIKAMEVPEFLNSFMNSIKDGDTTNQKGKDND